MKSFVAVTRAHDVCEGVAGAERIVNNEEWDGGDDDIKDSKKIIGEVFGMHVHDFGGGNNIEW